MVLRAIAVNWVSVESSVFTSAPYDTRERLLHLRFHSGDIYRYFEFPPEQYDEFLAADSKGEYSLTTFVTDSTISRFTTPTALRAEAKS